MIATMNGVPLVLVEEIEYNSSLGPRSMPSANIVPVPADAIPSIVGNQPQPIGLPGGQFIVDFQLGNRLIKNLRCIRILEPRPGSKTAVFRNLVLVDRRYFFERKLISLALNVRRRTGSTFASGDTLFSGAEEAAVNVVDLREFREGTLIDGKLATIRDAFIRMFEQMGEDPNAIEFDSGFGKQTVNPLEFTSGYTDVYNRIMRQAPDFYLTHEDSAKLAVRRYSDQTKQDQQRASFSGQFFELSSSQVVDMSFDRPVEIHVYLDIEAEMLTHHSEDYDESLVDPNNTGLALGTIDTSGGPFQFQPYFYNCITNPIRDLQIDPGAEVTSGTRVAEGSVLPAVIFFAGLQNEFNAGRLILPPFAIRGVPNHQVVRDLLTRPWERDMQYLFALDGSDELFSRIWGNIQNDFRSLYQLERRWRDRVKTIKASRVGVIDTSTFERAHSPVYTDYTIWPSRRLITQNNIGTSLRYGFQVEGYSDIEGARKHGIGRIVSVDSETGIMRMRLLKGTHGEERTIYPGLISELFDPVVADYGALDLELRLGLPLKAGHKMSSIMTFSPYYRQNKSYLHKVVVTPAEAETKLSAPLGPCLGPVWEIHIEPHPITTARFVWRESNGQEIINAFIFDNEEFPVGNLANPGVVEDVTRSAAAMIYSTMYDYRSGQDVFLADHNEANISGNIRGISTFAVPPDGRGGGGEMLTRITYGGRMPVRTFASLLSPETRATLQGLRLQNP